MCLLYERGGVFCVMNDDEGDLWPRKGCGIMRKGSFNLEEWVLRIVRRLDSFSCEFGSEMKRLTSTGVSRQNKLHRFSSASEITY